MRRPAPVNRPADNRGVHKGGGVLSWGAPRKAFHPEGEIATAGAAKSTKTTQTVRRAEAAGCPVLAWTIDLPAGRNAETGTRFGQAYFFIGPTSNLPGADVIVGPMPMIIRTHSPSFAPS